MPEGASVELGRYRHFPVLYLCGDFDDQYHSQLDNAVAELESLGDRLIISAMDATYMDSRSLGIVIGAHRRLGRRGGALAVAVGDSAVRRLFDILEVNRDLHLFAGLEEARGFLVSSMTPPPLV
jgi:anti-sigma B factor antagonist